jgi:DNA polymerase
MTHLHIDIETFSSVDLKKTGVHAYAESPDFEILVVAFAVGSAPVLVFDWDDLPAYFFEMLQDPSIMKFAHNAAFERTCFAALGYDTPPEQWRCTMVKAFYCGLPGKLETLSNVLALTHGKLKTGTALINYFCKPVKATKVNGGRTRNAKDHNPVKWQELKTYCAGDVEAEREIVKNLSGVTMHPDEWKYWAIDQRINDRGVQVDTALVDAVLEINKAHTEQLIARTKEITKLDNPNSLPQVKEWISAKIGKEINALTKDAVKDLLNQVTDTAVREVLQIRQQLGKTSIKKYTAMTAGLCSDGRVRGLFQFYGAMRTGRWAGRRVQLQNLPRIDFKSGPLDTAREVMKSNDYDLSELLYENIPDTLSQLIRTAIVAKPRSSIVACDFSAIEARVIAWLAGEAWRLEVFQTHGKIYEASASKMFNIPLESIGKDSPYRQRGKVAELALGYQGGVNALITMGGDRLGLSEPEMKAIVERWRLANPKIVQMWYRFQNLATLAVKNGRAYHDPTTRLVFSGTPQALRVKLLSGRELIYWGARIARNRFGSDAIQYWGTNDKGQFTLIDTYGGKLAENIVQAISRDLLCYAMSEMNKQLNADLILHVHDEIAVEADESEAEAVLEQMEQIMSKGPAWAKGLPLGADGFFGKYYKK